MIKLPLPLPLPLPLLILILILSSNLTTLGQSTINVPADYTSIQEALDAAEEETTILVAPGTYYENLVWPEAMDGIKLIGEQGEESTVLDGGGLGRVVFMQGVEDYYYNYPLSAEINGFTIQNGYMVDEEGAGLYSIWITPNLVNLIFRDNRMEGSGYGAGAHLSQFNGVIKNCQFIDNKISNGSFGAGAGLSVGTRGDVQIINCQMRNNIIEGVDVAYGVGLFLFFDGYDLNLIPSLRLSNCVIDNNESLAATTTVGGGAYITDDLLELRMVIDSTVFSNNNLEEGGDSRGGALYLESTEAEISNCSFISNSANQGAGIYFSNIILFLPTNVSNSVFSRNRVIQAPESGGAAIFCEEELELNLTNCLIDHNEGSTISLFNMDFIKLTLLNITHSTFAYNSGAIEFAGMELRATNSIFWSNGPDELITIDQNNNNYYSDISYTNCLVANGLSGIDEVLAIDVLDTDPLFVNEDYLSLTANSPCLNFGLLLDVDVDLEGNPRPLPFNSMPDIGAYEVAQDFAYVQSKFYLDQNENGIKDASEIYTSLGSVTVNNDLTYNNFRKEGIFVQVEQGPLTVRFNESWNPVWTITSQAEFTFLVDDENFSATVEFGLTPIEDIIDVQTVITNGNFRCGEEVDFQLRIKNRGTTIESGIARLILDDRFEEYSFNPEPDYVFSDHQVGWDFNDLFPSEDFIVDFIITAPLINTADEVGELYCLIGSLDIADNNRPNRFSHKVELRCSFDPNDKSVSPFRSDSLALVEADLVYKIRFQNKGNDYARNVLVTDTLDPNLDMRTFQLINSSHPDVLQVIINENIVNFEFIDIFLLDSLTNEAESHGFINFSIRPKEDVALNTNIMNTGHIYFDFNPSIVTNSTQSVMVDEFPTVATLDLPEIIVDSYPNPANDFISLSKRVDQVLVYNVDGKLVAESQATEKVDVTKLGAGVYFVEYQIDGATGSDKWVIVR